MANRLNFVLNNKKGQIRFNVKTKLFSFWSDNRIGKNDQRNQICFNINEMRQFMKWFQIMKTYCNDILQKKYPGLSVLDHDLLKKTIREEGPFQINLLLFMSEGLPSILLRVHRRIKNRRNNFGQNIENASSGNRLENVDEKKLVCYIQKCMATKSVVNTKLSNTFFLENSATAKARIVFDEKKNLICFYSHKNQPIFLEIENVPTFFRLFKRLKKNQQNILNNKFLNGISKRILFKKTIQTQFPSKLKLGLDMVNGKPQIWLKKFVRIRRNENNHLKTKNVANDGNFRLLAQCNFDKVLKNDLQKFLLRGLCQFMENKRKRSQKTTIENQKLATHFLKKGFEPQTKKSCRNKRWKEAT
jgi:hypothetical protein